MIDCLIIGDEIADKLTDYISGCATLTRPNISSVDYQSEFGDANLIRAGWDTVIISLGMSDNSNGPATKVALRELRHGIKANMVYWILPPESRMEIRNAVHDVAMGRQDGLIDVLGWTRTGPTVYGYKEIANKVR